MGSKCYWVGRKDRRTDGLVFWRLAGRQAGCLIGRSKEEVRRVRGCLLPLADKRKLDSRKSERSRQDIQDHCFPSPKILFTSD